MDVWVQDKSKAAPANEQCRAEAAARPPIWTHSSSSLVKNMATVQQPVHGPLTCMTATYSIYR